MATRRAFAERRQALVESIRQAIRSGELQPGDLLPSLRALGSQHQLSHTTVAHELRRLTHEGVLRSVPSVGFVVGHA
ncbi:winged helix-turn-helix domain-containing protein, partial [Ruania albidiflava]|uniref:winged helix-turn-helix domain-containing protein n=1 Tax=Ruania albidiflava TaxID=366586 RepID=UPI0023F022B3